MNLINIGLSALNRRLVSKPVLESNIRSHEQFRDDVE